MSPNDALKESKRLEVLKNVERYKSEIKVGKTKNEKFELGQRVLVKNEVKQNKMDEEFLLGGTIKKKIYDSIYEIIVENDRLYKRHVSQLRGV